MIFAKEKEIKELKLVIKTHEKKLNKINSEATKQVLAIYQRALSEAEVDLRYMKLKDRVVKSGTNFDAWEEWARSLYSIEEPDGLLLFSYRLRSKAREWKEEMSWDLPADIDCKEKIEQLIGYKVYDRQRERGDMEKDLSEI